MEQLLEQMRHGFNKADLELLTRAFYQAAVSVAWQPGPGKTGLYEYFTNSHKTLVALQRQETQFEYFVGLPERA